VREPLPWWAWTSAVVLGVLGGIVLGYGLMVALTWIYLQPFLGVLKVLALGAC
jgi:sensor histidine kinase YesM